MALVCDEKNATNPQTIRQKLLSLNAKNVIQKPHYPRPARGAFPYVYSDWLVSNGHRETSIRLQAAK